MEKIGNILTLGSDNLIYCLYHDLYNFYKII